MTYDLAEIRFASLKILNLHNFDCFYRVPLPKFFEVLTFIDHLVLIILACKHMGLCQEMHNDRSNI